MTRLILLIEDDPVTHAIVQGVIPEGFRFQICTNLQQAKTFIENEQMPSLIIIDRELPDGDGLTFCTQIRSNDRMKDVPIIFLTGKTSESDKVGGLFAGADDYISKPVSPLELKARIFARTRVTTKRIAIGQLIVDLASHRVFRATHNDQVELDLTKIEFKLLLTLIQTPDRLYSRESLLTAGWGQATNLSDRVVDTHLSHLRKKIDGTGLKIEALRGEGYRLIVTTVSRKDVA